MPVAGRIVQHDLFVVPSAGHGSGDFESAAEDDAGIAGCDLFDLDSRRSCDGGPRRQHAAHRLPGTLGSDSGVEREKDDDERPEDESPQQARTVDRCIGRDGFQIDGRLLAERSMDEL